MATGLAPAARGYTFQDAIGGVAILSVLFEEAEAVTIEDAFQPGDEFDDLILEKTVNRFVSKLKTEQDSD